MEKVHFIIDEDFEILKNTSNRLNYLFENIEFIAEEKKIKVSGKSLDKISIKREIYYHVYKEKINIENNSIRKKIYDTF